MTNLDEKKSKYGIYFLLVLLILIWGISWPISKMGLQYMPPIWFAASRLVIGTVTMFCVVSFLGKLIWPNKQDLKIIFVIGLLQVGLFMTLITLGLYFVDAGRSAVLVYTTPLWVVPISVIFFKVRPTFKKWLGFFLGIAGLLILFNPLEIDWSSSTAIIGNAILLLAAFCWAIAILCSRYMRWSRSPLELISWQLLVGMIPVFSLAIIQNPHVQIIWNSTLVFSLLYSGVLATAFAYWGTVVISKELPPITTSLSLLAIPVCGLIFSALLLHEAITYSLVFAMIFILSGLLCLIFDK